MLPLPGQKFICDKKKTGRPEKNFKHKTENGRKTPEQERKCTIERKRNARGVTNKEGVENIVKEPPGTNKEFIGKHKETLTGNTRKRPRDAQETQETEINCSSRKMIKKPNSRFMQGNVRGNSQETHGVTKGKHMGGTHGDVFVSDWS